MMAGMILGLLFYLFITASNLLSPPPSAKASGPTELIEEPFVEYAPALAQITAHSIFQGNVPPPFITIDDTAYPYDPLLLSVLIPLYTQRPDLGHVRFREYKLPPPTFDIRGSRPPNQLQCPGSTSAYVRYTSPNAPTFVILSGSFSEWKSGKHLNLVIHEILSLNSDANIITFDGFLSSTFLLSSCQTLPWPSSRFSVDLYNRLALLLAHLDINTQAVGLIGFSGGGRIALEMMALASEPHREDHLFGLGALAVNPVLHERLTFATIDRKYRRTSPALSDIRNLFSVLPHILAHLIPFSKDTIIHGLVSLYQNNPHDFHQRVWNEFIDVDLKHALRAVHLPPSTDKGLSWNASGRAWNYQQAWKHITGLKVPPGASPCYAFEPLQEKLVLIKEKTLITLTGDDLFISDRASKAREDSCLFDVMASIEHNPHLHLYNPSYGSHGGLFIDPLFSKIFELTFFKEAPDLGDS